MAQFIVTLEDPIFPAEAITSLDIRNSLMYGSGVWRNVSVRKYDPEGEKVLRSIPAIKRVRELLECSLRDAKFLVDASRSMGSAEFGKVKIEFVGEAHEGSQVLHTYRVIDNRE